MIFVDTSAFYALEVEGDVNHAAARRFLGEIKEGMYRVIRVHPVLEHVPPNYLPDRLHYREPPGLRVLTQ